MLCIVLQLHLVRAVIRELVARLNELYAHAMRAAGDGDSLDAVVGRVIQENERLRAENRRLRATLDSSASRPPSTITTTRVPTPATPAITSTRSRCRSLPPSPSSSWSTLLQPCLAEPSTSSDPALEYSSLTPPPVSMLDPLDSTLDRTRSSSCRLSRSRCKIERVEPRVVALDSVEVQSEFS